MAEHNELGKRGEDAACGFLKKEGYSIVRRNWIYLKYEIDIIAQKDEYIIFVEVKTRRTNRWGNPEQAVSDSKIRRIVEAADFYLQENNICLEARFDIIGAIWNGKDFDIDHIDDAFRAPVN
ncbi:MAG: YraN family protein [Dysgonomonas sp.]